MREYLFKAQTCNGQWVEGLLAHKDDKWYISNKAGMPFAYEVRPDTICQYTELTDKNGNRIWENDICDRKEPFPEIVRYHKGDWTLDYSYAFKKEYGFNFCNLGFYVCERNCVKVIGNIFDNPELVEGIKHE